MFKSHRYIAAGAAVAVVGVVGAVLMAGSPAGAAVHFGATPVMAAQVYMSPSGSGTACTSSAPCATLSAALAVAADGSVVQAAGGDYGSQGKLPKRSTNAPVRNVIIQSAPGETAMFGSTVVTIPGLTFTHVSFDGILRVNQGPTLIDNVTVIGGFNTGEIVVRGSYVTVQNSLVSGGYAHDGINIAGFPDRVHDVLVQNTTVRDIGGDTAPGQQHPDCVQIFDAYNIVLRQNDLFDCYNSAITMSPGAHRGIDHVTIESNFIQGCLSDRERCGNGGSAMDLRVGAKDGLPVSSIVVDHNTFGKGSLRLPYQTGVEADHNIVGYLSVLNPCTTALTDSVIAGYPRFACHAGVPGQTNSTSSGNVSGSVSFVDADNGDLHVTSAAPTITDGPTTGTVSTFVSSSDSTDSTDFDGQTLSPSTVGADQFS